MLNARLNELVQTANPPYIYAATYDDDFFVAKTKDAFTLSLIHISIAVPAKSQKGILPLSK